MKRIFIFFGSLLILAFMGFLLRGTLLQSIGNYLVKEDPLVTSDAIFVLAGEAYERSREAAVLYRKGKSPVIFTLGAETNQDLKCLGQDYQESRLMREAIIGFQVPDSVVVEFPMGSSTFEESEAILGFAMAQGFKRIIVISSKLHTRRVRKVFRKKFAQQGISVVVRGAEPEGYTLDAWWRYEKGLIFVNNEYVKLLYYAWRY